MRRHNAIRDALHQWPKGPLSINARTEQEVTKWNTPEENAILDIVYRCPRLGEIAVDISVVDSVFSGASSQASNQLHRREQAKHRRYPGPGLFAFVVDTRGRWAKEATAFVQTVISKLDPPERLEALRQCRRTVSFALQSSIAEQLMSAASRGTNSVSTVYLARRVAARRSQPPAPSGPVASPQSLQQRQQPCRAQHCSSCPR